MSTRAVYTFVEPNPEPDVGVEYTHFNVYKHHDGYPTGACEAIEAALEAAWDLPRFEADEFAAAFVAQNKAFERHLKYANERGHDNPARFARGLAQGGIRLMPTGHWQDHAPWDIEYHYEITVRDSQLYIKVELAKEHRSELVGEYLWEGTLDEFKKIAERLNGAETPIAALDN